MKTFSGANLRLLILYDRQVIKLGLHNYFWASSPLGCNYLRLKGDFLHVAYSCHHGGIIHTSSWLVQTLFGPSPCQRKKLFFWLTERRALVISKIIVKNKTSSLTSAMLIRVNRASAFKTSALTDVLCSAPLHSLDAHLCENYQSRQLW